MLKGITPEDSTETKEQLRQGGEMEKNGSTSSPHRMSKGVIIFGFTLIFVSLMFICIIQSTGLTVHSYGLTITIDVLTLLAWLVPALLGIGILRLSNFCRVATISIGAILAFWTPIMYFYSRMIFQIAGLRLPSFTKYEILDIFLILFGLCTIYFFTRPQIKEQFR